MSGIPTGGERRSYTADELEERIRGGEFHLPLYVERLDDAAERARLFIVANDWPDPET
jgi:hypothetical protein